MKSKERKKDRKAQVGKSSNADFVSFFSVFSAERIENGIWRDGNRRWRDYLSRSRQTLIGRAVRGASGTAEPITAGVDRMELN